MPLELKYIERSVVNEISPHKKELIQHYYGSTGVVLLGEPGSGKTKQFEAEAAREPNAELVTVRKFLSLNPKRFEGKTLYLDGLDEQRSRKEDGKEIIDNVITRLDQINCPRFRLSCREADWYGALDVEQLRSVSVDGKIQVLKLLNFDEQDIQKALNGCVDDPEQFIIEAYKKNVFDLLRRPLTLRMLAETVMDSKSWPSSKLELFTKSIELLAKELNPEHNVITIPQSTNDEIIEAAGALCTYHLISDIEGFAATEDCDFDNTPYFLTVASESRMATALGIARKKRFFEYTTSKIFVPVHRALAEYLAALYITKQIGRGLPLGRVIALITGNDRGSVTELRGLYAWLACLLPSHRRYLLSHDPLGIVLYGDVTLFPAEDKCFLLTQLSETANRYPWFRSDNWTAYPFGAFCTQDMEEHLRKYLCDRTLSHSFLDCIVDAVAHGAPLPSLCPELLNLIKDEAMGYIVRKGALEAFLNAHEAPQPILKEILDDIYAEKIEDSDRDLRGIILENLYPGNLTAREAVNYLFCKRQRNYIGHYSSFLYTFAEKTPDADVASVLNALVEMGDFSRDEGEIEIKRLLGRLIYKGLELYGLTISISTLYNWLWISTDEYERPFIDRDDRSLISDWFTRHPDKLTELYSYHLSIVLEDEVFLKEYRFWAVTSSPSSNHNLEIVNILLAQASQEQKQKKAEDLFRLGINTLLSKKILTVTDNERVFEYIKDNPRFSSLYEAMSVCSITDHMAEFRLQDAERERESEEKRQKEIKLFQSHIEQIRSGKHLGALHHFSYIFYGWKERSGNSELQPDERIANSYNAEIAQAVHAGFQGILFSDLPDVKSIANTQIESRRYNIDCAAIAGISLYFSANNSFNPIPEKNLSSILAFYTAAPTIEDTGWRAELIKTQPKLVAEALRDYLDIMLSHDREHANGIYELSDSKEMQKIREIIAIPLLKKYPLAEYNNLKYLISAALKAVGIEKLGALAEEVISSNKFDGWHESIWTTIAFLANPEKWRDKYFECHRRSRLWSDLLAYDVGLKWKSYCTSNLWIHDQNPTLLSSDDIAEIITMLGKDIAPKDRFDDEERLFQAPSEVYEISERIRSLINILGNRTDDLASNALHTLANSTTLIDWKNRIIHETYHHHKKKRDSNFLPPTLNQVKSVFANQTPINERDLFELGKAHLEDIAAIIRTDNPPFYRQFWNTKGKGELVSPKPEDDGRDALILALKSRLSTLGVSPEREGSYVENKRSDIKLILSKWNTPIEIKCDYNSELWTAINDQLIRKYTIDPSSGGYGIYVVLWFNETGKYMPRHPSGLSKPLSPNELTEMLGKTIPENYKDKIAIICLDCSRPISH